MSSTLYKFRMRDLGIDNKDDIFSPEIVSLHAPAEGTFGAYLKDGDMIQILYNNGKVPYADGYGYNTIYVWDGSIFHSIHNRWDIVSVYDVGPAFFYQYNLDLPDLKVRDFVEGRDGIVRSTILLGGEVYVVQYNDVSRVWAINSGQVRLEYEYCPVDNVINVKDCHDSEYFPNRYINF